MEQDFDKNLDGYFAADLRKAGLDSRPIPREWLQLATQLDAYELKKRERQQKWLWLLLALLLLSNFWTGFKVHHLQRVVHNLGTQQVVLDKPISARERVVVTDTVYQTLVIQRREYVSQSSPDRWRESQEMAGQKRAKPLLLPVAEKQPETQTLPQNSKTTFRQPAETQQSESLQLPIQDQPASETQQPFIAQETPVNPDTLVEMATFQKPVKTAPGASNPLKRKLRYHLGVGVGILHILNSRESETPAAFLAQWHGEILLGKHWAVSPSISFVAQNLELDHPADPRWMLQLPPSPDPDYSFQHLEGRLRYWLPAVQLRYYFRPESQWSWYAGGGYAARIFDSGDLDTEYYDPASHLEIKVESFQEIPGRYLNLTGQLGMTWRIKQSGWQLFADGNGIFDVGKGQRTFPMGFAQVGIKWGTR